MILVIDNYDSFVYNLARYVERLGQPCTVIRNDALTLQDIEQMNPEAIILSPGPCAPQQAGISIDLIRTFGPQIPILGVCLGHQAIGEAYGGETIRAGKPVHGKTSRITHDKQALFQGLPTPMDVGRYHSLVTKLPEGCGLTVTATSDDGEIMAIQHDHDPVYGVQFHPESILTPSGADLMQNFLSLARAFHAGEEHILSAAAE
ncbi:MAG: aminodeoxychorismate/anthranilate synthase component II [Alphaproteobacteria bacterium]|nr:aminodeoxychorismate/anthranilate synthase component II [Alphaproteobacteria bacterium]